MRRRPIEIDDASQRMQFFNESINLVLEKCADEWRTNILFSGGH